ncbi:MAG: hypothetical protein ACYTGS_05790 [Planctomycetota bacterium]|jgi:hypothetical protein
MSKAQARFALDRLRAEQNLIAGTLAGAAAALVGAGIWASISALTENQIGWMAIVVGFLVGYAVRLAGKGIDRIFGVVGAILSLMGCAVGNLLRASYFIAKAEGIPFLDLLAEMDFSRAVEIMAATFDPMDILFYAIAVYFGYRYSFRPVTEQDLSRSRGKAV